LGWLYSVMNVVSFRNKKVLAAEKPNYSQADVIYTQIMTTTWYALVAFVISAVGFGIDVVLQGMPVIDLANLQLPILILLGGYVTSQVLFQIANGMGNPVVNGAMIMASLFAILPNNWIFQGLSPTVPQLIGCTGALLGACVIVWGLPWFQRTTGIGLTKVEKLQHKMALVRSDMDAQEAFISQESVPGTVQHAAFLAATVDYTTDVGAMLRAAMEACLRHKGGLLPDADIDADVAAMQGLLDKWAEWQGDTSAGLEQRVTAVADGRDRLRASGLTLAGLQAELDIEEKRASGGTPSATLVTQWVGQQGSATTGDPGQLSEQALQTLTGLYPAPQVLKRRVRGEYPTFSTRVHQGAQTEEEGTAGTEAREAVVVSSEPAAPATRVPSVGPAVTEVIVGPDQVVPLTGNPLGWQPENVVIGTTEAREAVVVSSEPAVPATRVLSVEPTVTEVIGTTGASEEEVGRSEPAAPATRTWVRTSRRRGGSLATSGSHAPQRAVNGGTGTGTNPSL